MKFALTAVCATALFTAAAAAGQGVLPDRKTVVSVSAPVTIPGATLPAGTYVFKIADSAANRNIVQIFDKDEAKVITTLLAVPAERNEAEGDPLITFKETPVDHPPAVRYWYYAGEKAGNEFVYPKAQAMMIARASGESVSAVDSDATDIEGWKKGEVSRVTANAEPQSASTAATTTSTTSTTSSTATTTAPTTPAPTTAPEPTQPPTTTAPTPTTTAPTPTTQPEPAQPTTTAPVTTQPTTTAPTPAPTTTPTPEPAPTTAPMATTPSVSPNKPEQPVATSGSSESLPHTASELPTVGLIGFLALAGAFAVRVARRSLA